MLLIAILQLWSAPIKAAVKVSPVMVVPIAMVPVVVIIPVSAPEPVVVPDPSTIGPGIIVKMSPPVVIAKRPSELHRRCNQPAACSRQDCRGYNAALLPGAAGEVAGAYRNPSNGCDC
jgi:hypothetical protein